MGLDKQLAAETSKQMEVFAQLVPKRNYIAIDSQLVLKRSHPVKASRGGEVSKDRTTFFQNYRLFGEGGEAQERITLKAEDRDGGNMMGMLKKGVQYKIGYGSAV
jgi:hypothetical protein